MKKIVQSQLTQYNSFFKEIDEVYHSIARHYGISDCALWILYIVRETEDDHTQNKLCELLSLSKQTVNSALKKLEKEGYIKLEHHPGNQKNKLIQLTEQGSLFAGEMIDKLVKMEQTAFCHLSAEERITLLRLIEKYVNRLQKECKKLMIPEKSEENNS